MNRAAQILVPLAVGALALLAWEFSVRAFDVSPIVLPAPSGIWEAFTAHFAQLMGALWTTLRISVIAFVLAVVGGVALAVCSARAASSRQHFIPMR